MGGVVVEIRSGVNPQSDGLLSYDLTRNRMAISTLKAKHCQKLATLLFHDPCIFHENKAPPSRPSGHCQGPVLECQYSCRLNSHGTLVPLWLRPQHFCRGYTQYFQTGRFPSWVLDGPARYYDCLHCHCLFLRFHHEAAG